MKLPHLSLFWLSSLCVFGVSLPHTLAAQEFSAGDRVTAADLSLMEEPGFHFPAPFISTDHNSRDNLKFGRSYEISRVDEDSIWIRSGRLKVSREQIVPEKDAVDHFTKLVDSDSKKQAAYLARAIARYRALVNDDEYRKFENWQKCMEDVQHAIEIDEASPHGHYIKGLLEAIHAELPEASDSEKHLHSAIKSFGQAIDLDKTYVEAFVMRGQCWWGLDKFDLVIDDFTSAIELEPDNPDLFGHRGSLRSGGGDQINGLADLTEAIRLTKGADANLYYIRSLIQTKTEDKLADLEESVRIDPDFLKSHTQILNIHSSRRDWSKSLSAVDRCIVLNEEPMLRRLRGVVLLKLGKCEAAKVEFNKVRKNKKTSLSERISIDRDLALVLAESGKYQDALDVVSRLKSARASAELAGAKKSENAEFSSWELDQDQVAQILIYCCSPESEVRNAAKGLSLAAVLMNVAPDKTRLTPVENSEIFAIAYAANGLTAKAVEEQKKAIELAKGYGFHQPEIELMKQRLALYESGKAIRFPLHTVQGDSDLP